VQVIYDTIFNPPFRFLVSKNDKFLTDKLFKSRAEAIDFAKKWMRTHKRG
jgi:hypothetical protein